MAGVHHRGDYKRRAAHVRAVAYHHPTTRCWRCGHTLTEIRQSHPRATWQAGHLRDGDPTSPLAAECSVCNQLHGGRLGNQRMRANREPHSQRWFTTT
jgi:hypothetical protein